MNFFLVKDHVFSMINTGMLSKPGIVSRQSKAIKVNKIQLADIDNTVIEEEIYPLTLENSLVQDQRTRKSLNSNTELSSLLRVVFTLPISLTGQATIHVSNFKPDTRNCTNILKRLVDVFGKPNVKSHFSIAGFGCINGETKIDFDFKDLPIAEPQNEMDTYKCKFKVENLSASISEHLKAGDTFRGRLTVIVALSDKAVNQLYLDQNHMSDLSRRLQTPDFLEDPFCSDLVILARNGERLNCHKLVLGAASRVFKAMFQNATHRIKILDMSVTEIRALLKFIYHFDLVKASESCEIAIELYRAGHKYAIIDLENAMRDLLCSKTTTWFTVDVALEMLLFVKNLEQTNPRKRLLAKAVQVLKWYRDNDFGQFRNSVQSHDSPGLAMEQADAFLSSIL